MTLKLNRYLLFKLVDLLNFQKQTSKIMFILVFCLMTAFLENLARPSFLNGCPTSSNDLLINYVNNFSSDHLAYSFHQKYCL